MAAVIHQTRAYVEGLWLFDHEDLSQLDTILDDAMEGFAEIRKHALDNAFKQKQRQFESVGRYGDNDKRKEIDKEIRKDLESSYPYSEDKRNISISFTSGKTLVVPRFADAFHKPEIQNETPTVFEIETRCGTCELKMELPSYSLDSLRISVSPQELELSAEVFVKLKLWAEKKRQPNWQRTWQKHSRFAAHWFIWFAVVFLTWMVNGFSVTGNGAEREKVKEEARQMLQKGLKKEDESRAIELILAISSDYPQPRWVPLTSIFPRWWIGFAMFTFLIAVCLSFPPATVIGIGHGSTILARRKQWLAIFRFIFLTFALLSVGGSYVAALLFDYFKG